LGGRPGTGRATAAAEGGEPAADAAGIDAEEVGHLLRGVSVPDALDGKTTAVFQDLGGPVALMQVDYANHKLNVHYFCRSL
jgi:hypothetical protein